MQYYTKLPNHSIWSITYRGKYSWFLYPVVGLAPCLVRPAPCLVRPAPCLARPAPCLVRLTPSLVRPTPCLVRPTDTETEDVMSSVRTRAHPRNPDKICAILYTGGVSKSFDTTKQLAKYILSQHGDKRQNYFQYSAAAPGKRKAPDTTSPHPKRLKGIPKAFHKAINDLRHLPHRKVLVDGDDDDTDVAENGVPPVA